MAGTGRLAHPNLNGGGESFLSLAFLNMLLDIILRARDPKIVIEGLKIIADPDFPGTVDQINDYKEKFYEETLVLITEGKFRLLQVGIILPYVQCDQIW